MRRAHSSSGVDVEVAHLIDHRPPRCISTGAGGGTLDSVFQALNRRSVAVIGVIADGFRRPQACGAGRVTAHLKESKDGSKFFVRGYGGNEVVVVFIW
eukprot:CAMPEP_0194341196 /NCGR_PEP_ID=MMETSP0171-20130528/88894_1 /TAXON_ID=218684 /ORGANISM="Corethron pennatum, Strain L29A3" /LENGTH=97 /DNA_ID=CAMNT_0039106441 /DNA_START=454 /DNA_END=744 /DNA_ORIENTATION=-